MQYTVQDSTGYPIAKCPTDDYTKIHRIKEYSTGRGNIVVIVQALVGVSPSLRHHALVGSRWEPMVTDEVNVEKKTKDNGI